MISLLVIIASMLGKNSFAADTINPMEIESAESLIHPGYEATCMGKKLYEDGKIDEALKYFNQAAKHACVAAYIYLGKIHYEKSCYKTAKKWFSKAAIEDCRYANAYLGEMYFKGYIEQDFTKAIKHFRIPAELGDERSQIRLAESINACSSLGISHFDQEKYKDARKLLSVAAGEGCQDARAYLGEIYYQGYDVKKNNERALTYFKAAASQGHKGAKVRLDEIISGYTSLGVFNFKQKNYKEARKWFSKAAYEDCPRAQAYLGEMYFQGQGVPKNFFGANEYFKKSAAQGCEWAQVRLVEIAKAMEIEKKYINYHKYEGY
jgi:TPR repeat protein